MSRHAGEEPASLMGQISKADSLMKFGDNFWAIHNTHT